MNCKKCGAETDENGKCPNCAAQSSPKPLWNPNAVANWSLLFTPLFGAWLTCLNWQVLGEIAFANRSRNWLIAMMVWLPITAILLHVPNNPSYGIAAISSHIVLLLLWFFMENRKQSRYLTERFGKTYPRKSWGKPLVLAAIALVIWQLAIWVIWDRKSGAPRCDQADVQSQTMKLTTQIMQDELIHQYIPNVTYGNAKQIAAEETQIPDEQIVKQAMIDAVEKVDKRITELAMVMTDIRPVGEDERIQKSTCAANVGLSNGNKLNLTYSAQYTTDGELYVEVQIR